MDLGDEESPRALLCNSGGASLREVEDSAIIGPVKATGYLKWSGFAESDLALPELEFPAVVQAGKQRLDEVVKARTEELTATIVQTLKEEGSYPYADDVSGPVEAAERDVYDLVVVTARNVLGATKPQRRMSAMLLRLALQERPEALDEILRHTLRLTTEEREQLAEMLRYSKLSAIVGSAAEVSRRVELLMSLRYLLYDAEEAKKMREVDQLHPLVRDNVWLFGEEWRLTRSEAGLTAILRDVVKGQDLALESDLVMKDGQLVIPAAMRGRVDLLLERALDESAGRRRLVVELKRPSLIIGEKELAQVRKYAKALSGHPGSGRAKWTFWVIGTKTDPGIEPDMTQVRRVRGHVDESDVYDIFVTTWAELITQAERRFTFYQDQLRYEIGQDEAVLRVRERHTELLGIGTRRRAPRADGDTAVSS